VALRKIIAIKNVGRFQSYGASGDVTLKRYNLIFAENGRGKTTLCDILRSLRNGDPAPVNGRRTLGGSGAPEISILTDLGTVAFGAGAWTATLPALAIFDSTFVSQNVYSGDVVGLDHRRNLYRVIIGNDGVDLAHTVDELDADIRTKTAEIRDRRAYVQSYAPQGMDVGIFAELLADPDIDAKISTKQMELEALRQADQLKARAALTPLTLPVMPESFEALLTTTVEGLAVDAGRRLAAQIEAHGMHARGEAWLAEGLGYIRDEKCPFCSQTLATSPLIAAYVAHFSATYNRLRQQVTALRISIEDTFGDRAIAQAERTIDTNDAATEFWARYCDITRPVLSSSAGIGNNLRALRQVALSLLDRKIAAPPETIALDDAYTEARAAAESLRHAAATYNGAVQIANAAITAKKAATGNADVRAVESALRHLQAIKARHQPAAIAACQAHENALKEKETKEDEKVAARTKLDEHTEQVIGHYERSINDLLDDFQAGFRITETKHAYPGGVPSSSFQILINETAVNLGDASTPLDQPSFRNTLSSGDKSTLALAFFLAQLAHDPDKARRIVVFDDPFSSQDAFRKDHTVEKIRKCGESCTQVIVLSHDQGFLKRVWDRLAPQTAERKCLQLARLGMRNTAISEWDVEKATQQRFKADLKALADYYNACEGDPRDIVSKLRPVLETYCRNLYGGQFSEADMLAAIITKIRQDGPTHDLADDVDDMDAINAYTRRYHHGEGPNPATEVISDTELQGFVKKTLAITGYS
jgi:wobble nucleotide-excising tRNase